MESLAVSIAYWLDHPYTLLFVYCIFVFANGIIRSFTKEFLGWPK